MLSALDLQRYWTLRSGLISMCQRLFVVSVLDLPASAVDTPPPLAPQRITTVVSCCPMYFFPAASGVSSTSAVMLPGNITSPASAGASRQIMSGVNMEWYSGDSSQPPRTLPGGPRIDMLDPTEQVDFSALLPKSAANSTDLGNIDMPDWLDEILQPGCGMSGDFINITDDCDLCSSADGVRATFEKLMEVTTSNS